MQYYDIPKPMITVNVLVSPSSITVLQLTVWVLQHKIVKNQLSTYQESAFLIMFWCYTWEALPASAKASLIQRTSPRADEHAKGGRAEAT